MPLRAVCAVVWLAILCSGAFAAVLRDHLYAVKVLSPTDAWAVGDYGAILHSTNGARWQAVDSGSKVPLFGIDFASDGQHGWAVGKSAAILGTTDGGKTWKRVQTPLDASKHLFGVAVSSPTTAWAVGDWGTIAVTTDGGRTWEDRSLKTLRIIESDRPDREEKLVLDDVILYDVAWPDAEHGYLAGEFATLLATSDGGATWQKRTLPTEKTIFAIDFPTKDEGWAVGIDGLVMHTADGGATWEIQHGNPQPATIDELAFNDALKNPGMYGVSVRGDTGVVVGDTGTLLLSHDGGQTWTRSVLPDKDRYSWIGDASVGADGRGVIVGAKGLSGVVQGGDVTLADGSKATAAPE